MGRTFQTCVLDRHLGRIPRVGTTGGCLGWASQGIHRVSTPGGRLGRTPRAGVLDRHLGQISRAGSMGRCLGRASRASTSDGYLGRAPQTGNSGGNHRQVSRMDMLHRRLGHPTQERMPGRHTERASRGRHLGKPPRVNIPGNITGKHLGKISWTDTLGGHPRSLVSPRASTTRATPHKLDT